jgi:hypothetical protein
MPSYTFVNTETNEEVNLIMSIAEWEQYKIDNPQMKQKLTSAPAIGDSVRLGLRHHDNNFNDVLKNIKSHHRHSTINPR